jgi:hypothetical protein
MTHRRMLANASFRLSGSDVTHDVSGRSPSDVRVCQECGEHFRPKRPWQKQCSLAVGSEPMFCGIQRRHSFTTALESLQTPLRAKGLNRRCRR